MRLSVIFYSSSGRGFWDRYLEILTMKDTVAVIAIIFITLPKPSCKLNLSGANMLAPTPDEIAALAPLIPAPNKPLIHFDQSSQSNPIIYSSNLGVIAGVGVGVGTPIPPTSSKYISLFSMAAWPDAMSALIPKLFDHTLFAPNLAIAGAA